MTKLLLNLLLATISLLLLNSCASLTGFEEGKVLGEHNSEFTVSGNLTRVPDLFDDTEELDSLNESISFPNIEFTYKRGVSDKLDVGVRLNSNLNLSTFVKYQLVGDRSSPFALATGFEAGTVLGFAYNVGIPIYASYYASEKVTINLNPRFMYQAVTGEADSGVTYLGGNFGVLFGQKNKFGIDIGYFNVGRNRGSEFLLTYGIGGKFRFGDFNTSTRNNNRSRR